MVYTKENTSKYIGRYVRVNYVTRRSGHNFRSCITANLVAATRYNVIFDVNGSEPELILKYDQIERLYIFRKQRL